MELLFVASFALKHLLACALIIIFLKLSLLTQYSSEYILKTNYLGLYFVLNYLSRS